MPEESASAWRPAWFDRREPDAPPAVARLAAALRAINALLIETPADDEALIDLAAEAEALRDRLRALNAARDDGEAVGADPFGRDMRLTSPVTGLANVVAPPVRIWTEGDTVHGTASFDATYQGPPGHVHGGVIAAAFDEVLGATQSLTEQTGMTGTLTVRYRRPTPLYREVEFRGRLDRVSGRKLMASTTLHAGDTLCAEAEAIFVAVDFGTLRAGTGQRPTTD